MRLETQPFFALFCCALATATLFCTLAFAWPKPALLRLPVYVEDRDSPEAKRAQLEALSRSAKKHAQGDARLEAFVLAVGYHESRYALRIQRCECEQHECDPKRHKDGTIEHRARGLFQVWRIGMPEKEWEALCGPDGLDRQVKEATRRARSALATCRGDVAGAFSAYGGRACHKRSRTTAARVDTYRRLGGP